MKNAVAAALLLALAIASLSLWAATRTDAWTAEEVEQIGSLSLSSLEALPPDPSNRVADDPRAIQLGKKLFFDTRFSSNGKVACATCHDPKKEFQDGTPLAHGVGTTGRRTMPIAGMAYAPFLFWDGRKDSLWAQALGPLESPVEHGGSRVQYAHIVRDHYRDEYERLFGPLPSIDGVPTNAKLDELSEEQKLAVTQIFVNVGKSIAAFERRIQYEPSRFDQYADALMKTGRAPRNVLTAEETAGLRLFVGKANCIQCHNGPLLTNNEFHNTGVAIGPDPADRGRMSGARGVLADEFNCRSRWSDAKPEQCAELDFLVADAPELERAFKVPSLRNVARRAPYMHAGQMATLEDVVAHYDQAPSAPSGHSELKPLALTAAERKQLVAFLKSLSQL